MKKKAIILLSGGMDSAVTLYLAAKRGFKTYALIFDYGQRHKKELNFAKKIAKKHKTPFFIIKLNFPWKGSALLDRAKTIPSGRSLNEIKKGIPSTYVPARNLIFLSNAVSFAESIGADSIFIGAHTEDYSGYPDCRMEFFNSFKKTISSGTRDGKHIKICAPLVHMKKKDIVKLALKLKVPLNLTWSCYKGLRKPCEVCDSCIFRQKAFMEIGSEDPYYERS